jgi:hypothetical protein
MVVDELRSLERLGVLRRHLGGKKLQAGKILVMALLAILYLLVSVLLALMAGPIAGTLLFVVLLFVLGLILAFALPKLKES